MVSKRRKSFERGGEEKPRISSGNGKLEQNLKQKKRENKKKQKKKKKGKAVDRQQGHSVPSGSSSQALASHGIVDKVNANWKQLQASLKAARPASKQIPHMARDEPARPTVVSHEQTQAGSLSPKNSNCSLTKVLAMDCEMVGAGLDGRRSILARVSLVNVWGNVVYDKHVRPIEYVTDFRTSISGVRARDLRNAEDFAIVQKEVASLICGRLLVGHAVHNDLKSLYLSHPKRKIRDTALYPPLCSNNGRPRALQQLAAEVLQVKIQEGEHCSVEDARAAMYIYQHLKQEWEKGLSRRS